MLFSFSELRDNNIFFLPFIIGDSDPELQDHLEKVNATGVVTLVQSDDPSRIAFLILRWVRNILCNAVDTQGELYMHV